MARTKNQLRQFRQQRVRRKVQGTADRPRLAIFRSLHHLYAQLIDDEAGRTLASASTVEQEVRAKKIGATIEGAKVVGSAIADRAKSQNITTLVFDRGGFRYHGRVKALAEAVREKGLVF